MALFKNALYCGSAITLLTTGLFTGTANAQIEEILVEARKRQESLQDVPLSVTAFDQRAIQAAYSNTIDELDRFIPNVEFSDVQFSGQSLGASIRGVSFADLEKTFEPAVGVSIDGVFLATTAGATVDLFDIEQIEVLRGPQGTLFGRNTVGGVINVRRTRPTGELGLNATVRYGRHADREFRVIANMPQVADQLSAKFYFSRDASKTFAVNRATGEKEDFIDAFAGGVALLWEPTENFEALLTFDIYDDNSSAQPIYNLSQPTNGEGQNFFITGDGNFCDLTVDAAAFGLLPADQAFNGCRQQSLDIAQADDFSTFNRDFPFINGIEGHNITAEMNWDLDNGFTLTSVTGYRSSEEQLTEENIGAPNIQGALTMGASIPIFVANRFQEFSQFSQEFRAAGDLTEEFTIVGGVYYLNSDYSINGGPNPVVPGLGTGTAFVLGGPVGDFTAGQELNAFAIFADGTYDITDKFSFSGGIRYTREKKEFDIDFINPELGEEAVEETFSAITGRGIFQYQFEDDVMAFIGWSRGYRSGGFNGRATVSTAIGPYDEEVVDSFEGGVRAEFFDNRIRFNPTVFYAKYRNKQEEIIRASPLGNGQTETVVQNAATATVWGIELEGIAQIQENLNLVFAAGYLNASYDEFLVPGDPTDPNSALVDVTNTRNFRRAPEFSYSTALDYVYPLTDSYQMRFNAAYSWQDEFAASPVIDTTGNRRGIIASDGSADFSITFETTEDSGSNFRATAYINDAFDGRRGRLTNALDAGVFFFGNGSPTTVYGIELQYSFD
jgi:iron complex outermembrane receptor protein